MKVTLWLVGRDRLEVGLKDVDITLSPSIYQRFHVSSTYSIDESGNIASETLSTEPAPNQDALTSPVINSSYQFYGSGKELIEGPKTVSHQISYLVSACSNTSAAWYNGFQYPLSLKVVRRVEEDDKITETTQDDYFIRSESELRIFLVDTLRPLVKKHEKLEELADAVIFRRLIEETNTNFQHWRKLGQDYYQKAQELAEQKLPERASLNFSYARDFFEKAYRILTANKKLAAAAPVEQSVFLQAYSAFMYQMIGTQDDSARDQALILQKIGLCKANESGEKGLRLGLADFEEAYKLLYDAFGFMDGDTDQAKSLFEQAKRDEALYLSKLPRVAFER